jgi:acyl carrier protein
MGHHVKGNDMERQQFVDSMTAYLRGKRPDGDGQALTPDASLWDLGYLDSVSMVELIMFVEGLLGGNVMIDTSDVRSFGSIQAVYDHHVKPRVAAT